MVDDDGGWVRPLERIYFIQAPLAFVAVDGDDEKNDDFDDNCKGGLAGQELPEAHSGRLKLRLVLKRLQGRKKGAGPPPSRRRQPPTKERKWSEAVALEEEERLGTLVGW